MKGWWKPYRRSARTHPKQRNPHSTQSSGRYQQHKAPTTQEGSFEGRLIKVLVFVGFLAEVTPHLVDKADILKHELRRGCEAVGLCAEVSADELRVEQLCAKQRAKGRRSNQTGGQRGKVATCATRPHTARR